MGGTICGSAAVVVDDSGGVIKEAKSEGKSCAIKPLLVARSSILTSIERTHRPSCALLVQCPWFRAFAASREIIALGALQSDQSPQVSSAYANVACRRDL